MRCPVCSATKGLEVDMHSDGYADDLLECSTCGTIWLATVEGIVVIKRVA